MPTQTELEQAPQPRLSMTALTAAFADGKGDVMFALRVLHNLGKHPAFSATRLQLQCVTTLPHLAEPLQSAYPEIPVYGVGKTPPDLVHHVIIEAPTPFGPADKIYRALNVPSSTPVPILRIGEYGDPQVLSEQSTGRRALHTREALLQRHGKYIVSSGLDGDAMGVMHVEQRAIDSTHALDAPPTYQGYYRFGAACFRYIYLVCALEALRTPAQHNTFSILIPQCFDLQALHVPLLAYWGIGQVTWSAPGRQYVLFDGSHGLVPNGKTLHLRDPYPMDTTLMRQTMHAAPVFWGCTGDQSWSEGISAHKLLSYEIRRHKRDFFNQYVGVASPYVQRYLLAHAALIEGEDDQTPRACHDRYAYEAVAAMVADPALHHENKQVCQRIVADYDLIPWLATMITRVTAGKLTSRPSHRLR